MVRTKRSAIALIKLGTGRVSSHPYVEPHRTRRISDGGPDDYHHVIALCQTCHRRVHHGADGDTYSSELSKKLAGIEPA